MSTFRVPGLGTGQRRPTGTLVIVAVLVGTALANMITSGVFAQFMALAAGPVAYGEVWRVVTYGLMASNGGITGLFAMALNSLVLYMLGAQLEATFGPWRTVGIYLTALLGGAALHVWLSPINIGVIGPSAGILAMFAVNAGIKLMQKEDIRGDAILIGIFLLLHLVSGGSWWAVLGGVLTGGIIGAGLAWRPPAPRDPWDRNRRRVQPGTRQNAIIAGVAVLALIVIALRVLQLR
ncbi:rhomboid family intramembrane serine protease [Parenemella sanctibonifatiensis]|uniref:Peptidase S54 rhomboid domain-containing protein n=1 Tax=Parenemella sanctibonifatiensis TaxID=2016505 RepID=A0A255EFA2_9ACTN|nr:rhomboid family intramembrane serine protease [Parenemella sanctibonifatiensis]OYN90214.1 hypothetical protein CGZ91_08575 [Parenemella sanctibonifatiensis]